MSCDTNPKCPPVPPTTVYIDSDNDAGDLGDGWADTVDDTISVVAEMTGIDGVPAAAAMLPAVQLPPTEFHAGMQVPKLIAAGGSGF